ncbi:hypothetical protein M997_1076 [Proteus hauseri ATCC 700826]|uniref:Uncharacterized protein n=1 Tax=Proteus hauseri ATCC 700826 TaxID=1354271 RepID=A0AAJ3LUI2_PROHU|nr:hypothetical protein [Proteus hauseri]OAT48614.1 hypothetical protein M997_1076 [Proteus hauseri ATCC 700826]
MNVDNMKIMPQGMSSVLQKKISEIVLFINRDSVLSIVNSSNKFLDVKCSTGEYISEVEGSIYMDERDKIAYLKKEKYTSDSYFIDTNEKINFSENEMITDEVMVNKSIMNELIDDEDAMNYDNKSIIDDEGKMNSDNKERLKEIYTSQIDKYFSFIQLTNEDERIISSKIQFLLQKEIVFLEGFIEIEILNIKMKMVEKLSELVENCNFKEELLQKTKGMTLKDLLFRKDKENYYLTNIFSETLKKYYKYINRSKLYDIKRNKDASNSIISLVLAKYDKEGVI